MIFSIRIANIKKGVIELQKGVIELHLFWFISIKQNYQLIWYVGLIWK